MFGALWHIKYIGWFPPTLPIQKNLVRRYLNIYEDSSNLYKVILILQDFFWLGFFSP